MAGRPRGSCRDPSVISTLGPVSFESLSETQEEFLSVLLLSDSCLDFEVPLLVSASPEVTEWSGEAGRKLGHASFTKTGPA